MSKKKQPTLKEYVEGLHSEYLHWKDIYFNGCKDPSYCDGINLNLTRYHTIYYKRRIEELLGDKYFLYPDEYYWETPPEVPADYMAVDRVVKLRGGDNPLPATAKPFEIEW